MSLGNHGFFIDGTRYGNKSRFCNHSCLPNAQIKPYVIRKIDHNILVASEDILPNTEITYHYELNP